MSPKCRGGGCSGWCRVPESERSTTSGCWQTYDIYTGAMPGRIQRLAPFLLLAAPLAVAATPARAQQQDEQLWLQVNTNVPLASRVRITLEQIARFSDRQDGLYQTEFGGLLGFRASKNIELGFGYRWVGAHNGNSGADEDRLRQQVVGTFGPVTTRLRVDERFNPRGSEVGVPHPPARPLQPPARHQRRGAVRQP